MMSLESHRRAPTSWPIIVANKNPWRLKACDSPPGLQTITCKAGEIPDPHQRVTGLWQQLGPHRPLLPSGPQPQCPSTCQREGDEKGKKMTSDSDSDVQWSTRGRKWTMGPQRSGSHVRYQEKLRFSPWGLCRKQEDQDQRGNYKPSETI